MRSSVFQQPLGMDSCSIQSGILSSLIIHFPRAIQYRSQQIRMYQMECKPSIRFCRIICSICDNLLSHDEKNTKYVYIDTIYWRHSFSHLDLHSRCDNECKHELYIQFSIKSMKELKRPRIPRFTLIHLSHRT